MLQLFSPYFCPTNAARSIFRKLYRAIPVFRRCFLCDLSISCHESWLKVLSSVLKYRAALRAGSWKRNTQVNFVFHTNFKEVHAVYQQFDQCLSDVRSKLKILVYAKKRTHFEPLLLGLCRNTNEEECT